MILFKEASRLSKYLLQVKESGQTIGFVPTMGALHKGHLSLLTAAKNKASLTVCSIFVNPTQFNNQDDFQKYPITIERDIELLVSIGCDVLFLPATNEVYPAGYKPPYYDLGEVETLLEGHYRPGHFQGVCQVVDRLLQIVGPNFLFVGQKDFQQCQVIKKLLLLTDRTDIDLVIAPTLRESDGLAMSSRNLRLSAAQRSKAAALFYTLSQVKKNIDTRPYDDVKNQALKSLAEKGFAVDYFEIADAATLLPATKYSPSRIALVAAYLDDIRLIDNLPLN